MIIPLLQIIVSAGLVFLIILQERSGGMSGLLGGGDGGGFYQTRRGFQKLAFYLTIACTVAFIGLAVAELVL